MSTFEEKHYLKDLLTIAYPIILGNIGFILIGVGDVIVAGRHSTQTFAAISIANAIINCIMTLAMGLIAGISPILSNYRGQRKQTKRYFYPSIRFSMCLAFLMSLLILAFIPFIPHFGYEKSLSDNICNYMFVSALSTFGGCLHMCLKEFLQSFEIVLFPNLLTIFSVFLNLFLNIVFVFGFGFIKPMGVIGLAVSSLFVRYFMGFALFIYCYYKMSLRNYEDKSFYKDLIKIGLPISFSILIEFVAFNGVSIILGTVNGAFAAAQNLICTLTTISFMIPFAISNAIAVKVGFANGERNYTDIKNYSLYGIFASLIFIFFCVFIYLAFPYQIISLFTKDPVLFKLITPLMILISVFLIFDGLQISFHGICKGLKNTKILLFANFCSYWIVSIPIGVYLGLGLKLYLKGFWIGSFISGVLLCSILLTFILKSFKRIKDQY